MFGVTQLVVSGGKGGKKKKGQLGGAIGEYKHNLPRLSTLETVEN